MVLPQILVLGNILIFGSMITTQHLGPQLFLVQVDHELFRQCFVIYENLAVKLA